MLTRRQLVIAGVAAIVEHAARPLAQPAASLVTEAQKGDPDDEYEQVTFDPEAIRQLSDRSGRATFERYDAALPRAMLAAASGFIGASRTRTPERIAPLLALFGLPLRDRTGGNIAFCAAGVSYCALSAYADAVQRGVAASARLEAFRRLAGDVEHYYFYPTVSCGDLALIAKGKRRWRASTVVPRPGWIVLFDWTHRGTPDHCGIVQAASATSLFTVEFNTSAGAGDQRNGGVVAERDRTPHRGLVAGYIATDVAPGPI
jgi:hypothetical protein